MQEKNPYENLRRPGIDALGSLITPYKVIDIYMGEDESIQALIAHDKDGRYSFGYRITFRNGRKADKSPTLDSGWFEKESFAILYFLGMIMTCKQWFSNSLIKEVHKQTFGYGQYELF